MTDLNGKSEMLQRKDGKGQWKNYRMWLRLSTIQAYAQQTEPVQHDDIGDEHPEDAPF